VAPAEGVVRDEVTEETKQFCRHQEKIENGNLERGN
jgi:hypothetical protein